MTTLNPEVASLAGIMSDRFATPAAKASAHARLTAIARADEGKDPVEGARKALQAIVHDKDAPADQKKAAKRCLALLDGKPDDDGQKTPVGRAASATEIAALVAQALRPAPAPPDMAKLRAQHVARGAAIVESRLTPAQRELLARSAPRAESKTATIEGTAFVMPRRIMSRAEALARVAELEAEAAAEGA